MSAPLTREERTDRLADLRAREAVRKVTLSGVPLMDLPLERRIAFAVFDPGVITPRGDNYKEPLFRWQARAITYVMPETAAEVARLTAERDAYCDRVDTLTSVAKGNQRHVQEMYADLQKAHAEVARLQTLVTAMHAAAVGETRPPLLGLVEDVAGTRDAFLAQQARADTLDGIAREMAARVAELEDAPSRADVLREVEEKIRERAGELSDLAEEEMRRDLEERAQEWHEAANVAARMAEAGESA